MAQKRTLFWFSYWFFLLGIFGIHRMYLFGSNFRKRWSFLYILATITFAFGVFRISDWFLFTYPIFFIGQAIEGLFIKFNIININTLLFDHASAKINPSSESINLETVDKNQAQKILEFLETQKIPTTLIEIHRKTSTLSDLEDDKWKTEVHLIYLNLENKIDIFGEGTGTKYCLREHSSTLITNTYSSNRLLSSRDSENPTA
jgi:hypothetical protein